MPLMIGGGGDGAAFIRFKPSLNGWEMSSEHGSTEFEFDEPAIFDIENISLGWLLLDTGVREWKPWASVNSRSPKPDDREWKQGFELKVFSKSLFGNEPVRQFSANGAGVMGFIKELYDQCESKFGSGEVPVVQITGSKAIKAGKGNTRIPQFEIVKWVKRPADLGGAAASSAEPKKADKPKKEESEF